MLEKEAYGKHIENAERVFERLKNKK